MRIANREWHALFLQIALEYVSVDAHADTRRMDRPLL
jgi:hypothetical protein